MKKPESLRTAFEANNTYLQRHPDRLHVFVDRGRLVATSAAGTAGSHGCSFEYRYTLNLIITDYPESPNTLMMPIIAWARDWQPELLANDDMQRDGIKFEVDILNHKTADVSIEIQLTEAVDVKTVEGKTTATYRQEPMLNPHIRAFLGINT